MPDLQTIPARDVSQGDMIVLGTKLARVFRAWHHETGYIIEILPNGTRPGGNVQYLFEDRDQPVRLISKAEDETAKLARKETRP